MLPDYVGTLDPPFIYAFIDPIEPTHYRYIGMTTSSYTRPYSEYTDNKIDRKRRVYRWIKDLRSKGRDYSVVILKNFPSNTPRKTVLDEEKIFIRNAILNGHHLFNYNADWFTRQQSIKEPETRKNQCSGTVKNTGCRCSKQAIKNSEFCSHHGGGSFIRCSVTTRSGIQCQVPAKFDGLCDLHYRLTSKTK